MSEDSSGPKRLWKRKVLLINPRFQLIFLLYILVCAVLIIGIFSIGNLLFFKGFMDTGMSLGLAKEPSFFEFVSAQRQSMNTFLLSLSLMVTAVMGIIGLYISHRVAGPLYRLKIHMDQISEGGERTGVKFRKGDFFTELASSFNKMIEK
ncbi:MAG: methyl-accepting chemotaxis protein [Bacteriovoracaceae bacterium]|jgi:methyl-accepting chemotaxis protein|nr:methyl-accepting chemotaxis protein [Bacteriovoracaceae bacterium]